MKIIFEKLIGSLSARQHPGLRQPSAALDRLDRVATVSRNTEHAIRLFVRATILITAVILLALPSPAATNYTAHEWGTFTSVQGGNGKLLSWQPLQSSELPKFVYDFRSVSSLVPKLALVSLQRLETPVIYFYAKAPMSVDVAVSFPKGNITEWYPQVTTFNAMTQTVFNGSIATLQTENRAVWRNLGIFPDSSNSASHPDNQLPQDSSGSHYFAARATSANFVRATIATNNTTELEKFIFYRGTGNFDTPLRVTLDANNMITVENTGDQSLAHLFLLNIHDGKGAFAVLDDLASKKSLHWQQLSDALDEHWKRFDLAQFKTEIGLQMQAALTSAGLYPDEARAMVNTWHDSWFTEEGVRVLYLLPRPWTDEILPLTLTPQPTELTRVMVGRAEVITPPVETNLFQLVSAAHAGDATARAKALTEFAHLGRFANPALQLAMAHTTDLELMSFGSQLLNFPSGFE